MDLKKIISASPTLNIYKCSYVFGITPDYEFKMIKNRTGEFKDSMTIEDVIKLFCEVLALKKYNGGMKLFHETFKKELEEIILKKIKD